MKSNTSIDSSVIDHYLGSDLLGRIRKAIKSTGLDPESLELTDIRSFDEFHIGGASATDYALSKLRFDKNSKLLDIGCGIGGPARHIASMENCHVTGIDLTPGYIEVAQSLSKATSMDQRTTFDIGNALDMPYKSAQFDTAISFHVSMNIQNRLGMYREAARVLKQGGTLCLYDVLKGSAQHPRYPMPWASTEATSFLMTIAETCSTLEQAGFQIELVEDRSKAVADFFSQMASNLNANPNPLGLQLVMGNEAPIKIGNLMSGFESGIVKPVLIIANRISVPDPV